MKLFIKSNIPMQGLSGPHHEKHCINPLTHSHPVGNTASRETCPQLIKNQPRVAQFLNLTWLRQTGAPSVSPTFLERFSSPRSRIFFLVAGEQIQVSILCFQSGLFFPFNLLGCHWLTKVYRFQVYSSVTHHLYTVLCSPPQVAIHHYSSPLCHFPLSNYHSVFHVHVFLSIVYLFFVQSLHPLSQPPQQLSACHYFACYLIMFIRVLI